MTPLHDTIQKLHFDNKTVGKSNLKKYYFDYDMAYDDVCKELEEVTLLLTNYSSSNHFF